MNDNYHVFAVSSLALQMMSVSEDAAQPWVAMGYLCLDTKKATRAVYFAQKVKVKGFTAKCNISIMLSKIFWQNKKILFNPEARISRNYYPEIFP